MRSTRPSPRIADALKAPTRARSHHPPRGSSIERTAPSTSIAIATAATECAHSCSELNSNGDRPASSIAPAADSRRPTAIDNSPVHPMAPIKATTRTSRMPTSRPKYRAGRKSTSAHRACRPAGKKPSSVTLLLT